MSRGGKRPGAGRRKGSKNKAVLERERAAAKAAAAGLDPLQYVLDVMRDPRTTARRRDWAAATALPYVRARLQTIPGDSENPVTLQLDDLSLARAVAFLLFKAMRSGQVIDVPQQKIPA